MLPCLIVFGRVPLFPFVLHFYAAGTVAVMLALSYGASAWSFVLLRYTALRLAFVAATALLAACASGGEPAPRLTDEEFWRISTALSEPGGSFHTDNLVSNELSIAYAPRQLQPAGGVYIGVGPEQNFSYIAALEPELAFIIDIRRENLVLHLLYKALFELSADRAAFLSRLFSRQQPPGLIRNVPVDELVASYDAALSSKALLDDTTREVTTALSERRGWLLSDADASELARVLEAFAADGPLIHYDRTRPASDQRPSYATLMLAADQMGVRRSYLASEERFAFVKDLHARNLIIPVVGDFGGGVIARVGDEIRRRGDRVTAFYASNVEVYLTNQQMIAFCGSLRGLPWDSDGVFIDSKGVESLTTKLAACPPDRRPFAGSKRPAPVK